MTELFLVNLKHDGSHSRWGDNVKLGDWVCFRTTHRLHVAHDIAKELREDWNAEVTVQSVLLDENGKVHV